MLPMGLQSASPRSVPAHVLVVDDDKSMCDLLGAELAARGFEPSLETDPERVLESLLSRDVDAVITDLKMRGMNGLELCERIVAARPDLPVVLLTAHADLNTAVAALRVRAFDFQTKPPDMDALAAILAHAIRQRRLEQEVRMLDEEVAGDPEHFEGILGASPPMRELVQLVGRVAAVDAKAGSGRFEWIALRWNENAFRFYRSLGAKVMDDWALLRMNGREISNLVAAKVKVAA